jgi:hypothetical protein
MIVVKNENTRHDAPLSLTDENQRVFIGIGSGKGKMEGPL